MSVLKRVLTGLLGFLRTILIVAGWLLVITAVGAFGLAVTGTGPVDAPWYATFVFWWIILLPPAVIVAAIVAIIPKGRHTPVFTPVFWAAAAVSFLCGLIYFFMSFHKSP